MQPKSRNTKKYREWKNKVLEKDNYKCNHCGTNKGIIAHHIVPWKVDIKLRYEVNNGLTLCRRCHMGHHKNRKGICGIPAWNKGLKGSKGGVKKGTKFKEEHKEKLRKAKIGYIPWNKGIPMKESTKKIQSLARKGKKWIIDPITGKRKWID